MVHEYLKNAMMAIIWIVITRYIESLNADSDWAFGHFPRTSYDNLLLYIYE